MKQGTLRELGRYVKKRMLLTRYKLTTRVDRIEEKVIYAYEKRHKVGYFFPYYSRRDFDYREQRHLSAGFSNFLLKKYTEDPIGIQQGDTVIDCGAFVGGFSVAAVHSGAERVISVEPSSKNYKCLRNNLSHHGVDAKVTTLNMALGEQEGEGQLNLSKSGCDDSLIEPDEGSLEASEKVDIKTIDWIIREHEVDPRHLYLKVEAEGFEPEILKGIGNHMPRVITVDVTPERDGESPRKLIESILRDKGYSKFVHTQLCLFATN